MKKKIMITSRGYVTTSRGQIFTPTRPFIEDSSYLMKMIAGGAKVIEILPDGTEIPLTEQNFNTDNTVKVEPKVTVKEEKPMVNEKTIITTQLSRKERKQIEYERQMVEKKAKEAARLAQEHKKEEVKVETPAQEVTTDTSVDEAIEQ